MNFQEIIKHPEGRRLEFKESLPKKSDLAKTIIGNFKNIYKEKTKEEISTQVLKKLALFSNRQNEDYPTNALLLFSDDELRNRDFHYAKIECARFKGTSSEAFIDKKTIKQNEKEVGF